MVLVHGGTTYENVLQAQDVYLTIVGRLYQASASRTGQSTDLVRFVQLGTMNTPEKIKICNPKIKNK